MNQCGGHGASASGSSCKAAYVVAKLTDIWRPVELIPCFGKQCPVDWTADNAVELSEDFYLNVFSDKDVYQAIQN